MTYITAHYISAADAARAIGVTRPTLVAMIRRGELPGVTIGRRLYVTNRALDAWMADKLAAGGGAEDNAKT